MSNIVDVTANKLTEFKIWNLNDCSVNFVHNNQQGYLINHYIFDVLLLLSYLSIYISPINKIQTEKKIVDYHFDSVWFYF
jgi:hypothetical protein